MMISAVKTQKHNRFNYNLLTTRNIAFSLAILILSTLSGCGSSDPEPAPVQAPPKKPVAPIKPVVKKPPANTASTPKVANSVKQPKSNIPPGTNPQDIFDVNTKPPVYQIIGPAKPKPQGESISVTKPDRGRGSSHFTITYRPVAQSSSNRDQKFRLPERFEIIPSGGYAEDGRPWRIRSIPDEMIMAYVPGGEFLMGSAGGADNAKPPIKVKLDPFYIDTTEVTLKSYNKYRDYLEEQKKRVPQEPSNASSPENHPVLGVSWVDANGFASILEKDLPTEAQWEFAARGPESLNHPWGKGYAIWQRPRNLQDITPVKSYRTDQSPFGVFDMAGNAREWCLDWYSDNAFQEAAGSANKSQAIDNYTGPRRAKPRYHRVVKGNGPGWVLWQRWPLNMRERYEDVGFRTVLNVPKAETEPENRDGKTKLNSGKPNAKNPGF